MKPRSPTRPPKPPPFQVGTRLRYLGTRVARAGWGRGPMVTVIEPGIEVTIARTNPGRRGTGQLVEDDGESWVDETKDGYSVYEIPCPGGRPQGRIIRREDAKEWEVLR